ncbi:MAG: DUF1858 domain-containing protein [bacterium]|nr:DUF1858 domain-containing protein [bacterium]
MDKYPRMFMIASITYLLIGTTMGTMMASHLLDPAYRFIHIHLNLFGFMAMMVFGVAYHILPRFMGKTINWPALVPTHFYVANIGLIGMMFSYLADGYIDPDQKIAASMFEMFAGFSTLAVILFAVNIIPVLLLTQRKAVAAPSEMPAAGPATSTGGDEVEITTDMKIGEILEKKPGTLNVFINAGFKAFADPEKRKAMGDKLVLKTACQIKGIKLDELLAKLNGPVSNEEVKVEAPASPELPKQELSLKRGDLAVLTTPVGHMIQVYPETKKVLEDNYGGECFTCPGMAVETIEQTANMHNKKPEDILNQVNTIVKDVLGA